MTNQLIADLMGMGLSQAEAWRVLDTCDRITDGVPREVAEQRMGQLVAYVLARRFGKGAGQEKLVPPEYDRT